MTDYPEDIMKAAREVAFGCVERPYNKGTLAKAEARIAAALLAERERCAVVVRNAPMRFAGQTEEHVRRKLASAIMGGSDE